MTKKIYNQTKVESPTATEGNRYTGTVFAYRGFNSKNTKNGFKQYDVELIKQDLLNHFQIRKGQKLMNPQFGTDIWDMVFEPMTDANMELIKEDVKAIVNRDPRIIVNDVLIDSTEKGIRVDVELTFIQLNITEQLSLSFNRNTE